MNQRNTPCTWCGNAGYFGDFAPGIYPMPCPHCGRTGLEGIVSQETSEKISAMRNELYERIGKETDRWKAASEGFKSSLLLILAKTRKEAEELAVKAEIDRRRLGTFPQDYLPIEERSLQESWELVKELVDTQYSPRIIENSRKVLGKTYLQNAIMEITVASMRNSLAMN